MLTKLNDVRSEMTTDKGHHLARMELVLWSVWTVFVISFAFVHWQLDLTAHHPSPLLGLIIHTLLAGLVGLIVMTLVEMRIDPERFIDRIDS